MSLVELFKRFPDDITTEWWFADKRWSDGVHGARYESAAVSTETGYSSMPYRCRTCRWFFSAIAGTVMHGSNVGYRKWVIAIYLRTTRPKGTSSLWLHQDLGVTQKTAWYMAHRIRLAWKKCPQLARRTRPRYWD